MGIVFQEVELVCFDRVFCVAKSSVKIKDKKILAAIASNLVGIGQLFQFFSILPKFELLKAERKSKWSLQTLQSRRRWHHVFDSGDVLFGSVEVASGIVLFISYCKNSNLNV